VTVVDGCADAGNEESKGIDVGVEIIVEFDNVGRAVDSV
jgi:hypothetical protein